MVSRGRLELPWVSPLAPKASASANFAISTILRQSRLHHYFYPIGGKK